MTIDIEDLGLDDPGEDDLVFVQDVERILVPDELVLVNQALEKTVISKKSAFTLRINPLPPRLLYHLVRLEGVPLAALLRLARHSHQVVGQLGAGVQLELNDPLHLTSQPQYKSSPGGWAPR